MNKMVAIIRKDKTNNSKDWICFLHESIFDISRVPKNAYTTKRLVELERLILNNESITYEVKLIDKEEYEAILFNYNINFTEPPKTLANFSSFLLSYARRLDETYHGEQSKLYFSNDVLSRINEWLNDITKTVKSNKKPTQ